MSIPSTSGSIAFVLAGTLTLALTGVSVALAENPPKLDSLEKQSVLTKQLDNSLAGQMTQTLSPVTLQGGLIKSQQYPIDLPTILELTETQNLLIRQSELGTKIKKNEVYRSVSQLAPDVNWSYSYNHFSGGFQIFGNEVLNFTQTKVTPGMQVTNTWYPGGRQIFEILSAQRRFKSQKYLLEETTQDQLVGSASAYYALLEATIQHENALQSLKEAETQLKLSDARFKVGVGTKLDVMQSKSFLAEQEKQVIDRENALAQAEQALLNRLNLDTTIHLTAQVIDHAPKQVVKDDVNLNLVLPQVIRNHPEIRQLDFQVKALKLDLTARASDIIPSFNLDFTSSYVGPEIGELTRQKSSTLRFQTALTENGGLALPLDIRKLVLQVKQKKAERDQAVRDLESAITNASLNTQAAKASIDTARNGLEASEEAYRLASGRYKAGLGIYLDVLNAQTKLADSRSKLASAILTYNQSELSLLKALGQVTPKTVVNGIGAQDFVTKKSAPEKVKKATVEPSSEKASKQAAKPDPLAEKNLSQKKEAPLSAIKKTPASLEKSTEKLAPIKNDTPQLMLEFSPEEEQKILNRILNKNSKNPPVGQVIQEELN